MSVYLWKDTERICLNISWISKYYLYEDRIIIESGIFRKTRSVVMLYRVVDIESSQGFIQRQFDLGDVVLHTNDKTNPVLTFKGVKEPTKVMDIMVKYVEKARDKKGIRISEFQRSPISENSN